MEKSRCQHYSMYNKCYFGPKKGNESDEIHIGTENKLRFIELYAKGWASKVLLKDRPYDSVVFVDAMCSCGEYINQKSEIIPGTSLRVLEIFKHLSANNHFKNKKFHLILNDIDHQSIECQKCRTFTKFNSPNVKVQISENDVKDFMMNREEHLPIRENFHMLFYYDPYKVDIYWSEIKKYLNKPLVATNKTISYDLIMTHFHQHDTIRVLGLENVGDEVIRRFENSYSMKYENLKDILKGLDEFGKRRTLREIFKATLSKNLNVDNSKITYAPVFNKVNRDVYDIVFYSRNSKARQLFKETIYLAMKSRLQPFDSFSQKSLGFFENDDDKFEFNSESFKEIEFYYSIKSYANIIANHFSGKSITNDILQEYLENHEFIPSSSIKTELDEKLKHEFGTVITTKPKKNYQFTVYNKEISNE